VLTLQKRRNGLTITLPMGGKGIEDLLSKEWLLTNERGGYASSTVVGCNTRRYHGLLVGSLNPPINRVVGLSSCLEMLIFGREAYNLSTFEFPEKFSPEGSRYLKQFRRSSGIHFDYEVSGVKVTKSVYLLRDSDTVGIVYDFVNVTEPLEFALRPFVALRDFHSLQKSYSPLYCSEFGRGVLVRHEMGGGGELFLSCPSMSFEKDPQWWFNFVYREDRERGQEFTEDLWTPGFFKCRIESGGTIVFWANLSERFKAEESIRANIKKARSVLERHEREVISGAKDKDEKFITLCLAAEAFITKRQGKDGVRTTILAGFPWFADWGRDAFISLDGLLLCRGKYEEAKSVLTSFAAAADEGMIPNRFDDYSDTAYFNSIDAALWFIRAAFEYLNVTGDSTTFRRELLPTVRWIIECYYNGTKFGIHADTDGLITGGNSETQLTWMDAKYGGAAITARCGKTVEVNALWYDGLCELAEFYSKHDADAAEHYHSLAAKVKSSFCKLFWNDEVGYLNDCILPEGVADSSLRPNQIFAVSLPFSVLTVEQQRSVVEVVEKNLLTPYGLRTLNVEDSRYKGSYIGSQQERDEAYHQGTVWPYLMGPFVEAYLRVNDFSEASKAKAGKFIEPLLKHLTEEGCVGQVGEIFDGDLPHKPRGCIAQAWSVAELIRAYLLIKG